jgi:hypothetical protein
MRFKSIQMYIVWGLAVLVALSCTRYPRPYEKPASSRFGPAISWQGITPGQTLESEARAILGEPLRITEQHEFRVLRYTEMRDYGGWEIIDLWVVRQNDGRDVVIGVLRISPYKDDKHRPVADVQTLSQLVTWYGRPEQVSWSLSCHSRFLFWASRGIAALVTSKQDGFLIGEYTVFSVLLVEPMSTRQLIETTWPLPEVGPAWTSENLCAPGTTDAPEDLPEDPYDWEELLAPDL